MQSRAKERLLGRNAAHPLGNTQPKGGGLYRGRGGQVMWRAGDQHFRGGNQYRGTEIGLNPMVVDRGKGGDRTCYMCGKWGHIAKNCWQRKRRERRIVKTLQESAKDNGGQ